MERVHSPIQYLWYTLCIWLFLPILLLFFAFYYFIFYWFLLHSIIIAFYFLNILNAKYHFIFFTLYNYFTLVLLFAVLKSDLLANVCHYPVLYLNLIAPYSLIDCPFEISLQCTFSLSASVNWNKIYRASEVSKTIWYIQENYRIAFTFVII